MTALIEALAAETESRLAQLVREGTPISNIPRRKLERSLRHKLAALSLLLEAVERYQISIEFLRSAKILHSYSDDEARELAGLFGAVNAQTILAEGGGCHP